MMSQESMDYIKGNYVQCPLNPWMLSSLSLDFFFVKGGIHGHCPYFALMPWMISREQCQCI